MECTDLLDEMAGGTSVEVILWYLQNMQLPLIPLGIGKLLRPVLPGSTYCFQTLPSLSQLPLVILSMFFRYLMLILRHQPLYSPSCTLRPTAPRFLHLKHGHYDGSPRHQILNHLPLPQGSFLNRFRLLEPPEPRQTRYRHPKSGKEFYSS